MDDDDVRARLSSGTPIFAELTGHMARLRRETAFLCIMWANAAIQLSRRIVRIGFVKLHSFDPPGTKARR